MPGHRETHVPARVSTTEASKTLCRLFAGQAVFIPCPLRCQCRRSRRRPWSPQQIPDPAPVDPRAIARALSEPVLLGAFKGDEEGSPPKPSHTAHPVGQQPRGGQRPAAPRTPSLQIPGPAGEAMPPIRRTDSAGWAAERLSLTERALPPTALGAFDTGPSRLR